MSLAWANSNISNELQYATGQALSPVAVGCAEDFLVGKNIPSFPPLPRDTPTSTTEDAPRPRGGGQGEDSPRS